MKKLMMAVAIVCAAVGVQAATYSWNSTGMAAYSGSTTGYSDFTGYTVYAFDANTIALETLKVNLATLGADDLSKALDSGVVGAAGGSPFQFAFSGTGITDDGGTDKKFINGYLVLVSDKIDGKQYFATAAVAPIEVAETVISSGAPLNASFMMSALPADGATGWTQVATAVPEPTSGLLLLLGVAGLALRRRRA